MSILDEGFVHKGRLIWGVQYWFACGTSQIVWLNRQGNDMNALTTREDSAKPLVTTKPGDWIVYQGKRYEVAEVRVYRESGPQRAEQRRRDAVK